VCLVTMLRGRAGMGVTAKREGVAVGCGKAQAMSSICAQREEQR
jgi:hypothetical protein